MKYFTLHLGSPRGTGRLDEADRLSAIHKVARRFTEFTVTGARRFRGGRFEDVLLVGVASGEARRVVELAADLRRTFDLKFVGIEHGGCYLMATAETGVDAVEARLAGPSGPIRGRRGEGGLTAERVTGLTDERRRGFRVGLVRQQTIFSGLVRKSIEGRTFGRRIVAWPVTGSLNSSNSSIESKTTFES